MNRINNNNIIKENELKNNLNKYKEGSDYSVSLTEENEKKIYTFHDNELRSRFGNSRPVSVREENYKDENLSYWGRFEQGENYTASVQTWNYGKNHKFEPGIYPFERREWSDKNWIHGFESRRVISEENNIYESKNDEVTMHKTNLREFQQKKHDLEMKIIEERDNPKSCCDKHLQERIKAGKPQQMIAEWKKDIEVLETKIQYEKDWLDKNANNLLIDKNPDDNQSKLIKENQDLRKQLVEVKQELVRVSKELKKLKDNLTDEDKEKFAKEFIEIQKQNDELINNPNVSAAEIKEHTVKVEDLGKKVNARNVNTETFSTNSPDGKDNSNLLVGGGVALISILTVGFGYYLVKKKKNK